MQCMQLNAMQCNAMQPLDARVRAGVFAGAALRARRRGRGARRRAELAVE